MFNRHFSPLSLHNQRGCFLITITVSAFPPVAPCTEQDFSRLIESFFLSFDIFSSADVFFDDPLFLEIFNFCFAAVIFSRSFFLSANKLNFPFDSLAFFSSPFVDFFVVYSFSNSLNLSDCNRSHYALNIGDKCWISSFNYSLSSSIILYYLTSF